jgi:hypothetical protein
MKNIKLLFFIALTFLVLSCEKDKDHTKKELLSIKNWILVAESISTAFYYNGVPITDTYSQYDACIKDDIASFETNGTYSLEEGATKCDVNDPQVFETGTWTFNSDETILVMTSNIGEVINNEIVELTANKVILKVEETIDEVNYTLTSTYQKN